MKQDQKRVKKHNNNFQIISKHLRLMKKYAYIVSPVLEERKNGKRNGNSVTAFIFRVQCIDVLIRTFKPEQKTIQSSWSIPISMEICFKYPPAAADIWTIILVCYQPLAIFSKVRTIEQKNRLWFRVGKSRILYFSRSSESAFDWMRILFCLSMVYVLFYVFSCIFRTSSNCFVLNVLPFRPVYVHTYHTHQPKINRIFYLKNCTAKNV